MTAPYTEDQLTDWFPPHLKPARPGVYNVRLLHKDRANGRVVEESFARYDGCLWSEAQDSPQDCIGAIGIRVAYQNKSWRGLNFDPAQPAPVSTKTALQQFAEGVEFKGPDEGGMFWVFFGSPELPRVGFCLGSEAGLSMRFEQLRVKALAECKR